MAYISIPYIVFSILTFFSFFGIASKKLRSINNFLLAFATSFMFFEVLLRSLSLWSEGFIMETYLFYDRLYGKYTLIYFLSAGLLLLLPLLFFLKRIRKALFLTLLVLLLHGVIFYYEIFLIDPNMISYRQGLGASWYYRLLPSIPLFVIYLAFFMLWAFVSWRLYQTSQKSSNPK